MIIMSDIRECFFFNIQGILYTVLNIIYVFFRINWFSPSLLKPLLNPINSQP